MHMIIGFISSVYCFEPFFWGKNLICYLVILKWDIIFISIFRSVLS